VIPDQVRVRKTTDYDEARVLFREVADMDPSLLLTYCYWSDMEVSLGNLEEAEHILKRGIRANDTARILLQPKLALVYWRMGRHDQVVAALEQVVQDAPRDDVMLGALGKAYRSVGREADAARAFAEAETIRLEDYNPSWASNYRELVGILRHRGIRHVVMQYPTRSLAPLKAIFQGMDEGLIYVENRDGFLEQLAARDYSEIFTDEFAGDFGHTTPLGDRLIASNLADVLLKFLQ